MSKVTSDRLGVRVDIITRKGASFHRRFHTQIYSGDTLVDMDLLTFSGATLEVRKSYNSPIVELTLSTSDGSITLQGSGRFDLELSYDQMNKLRSGEYVYDMYLQSATYPKRDFIYGTFTISEKVTS